VRFVGRALSVVAFGVVASTFAVDANAQDVTPDARVHFAAGVNLLRDPAKPRYEEAYREFKAAYAISPVTQILGNLGLCAMMLERDSEAIEAYGKYLKGMIELDPKEREQIERDLQTLQVGVTRVTLSANLPNVTVIDQRIRTQSEPVTNVYGPLDGPVAIGIRPGHHVMTARVAGRPEITWEIDTSAGEMAPHVFEFPKEEERARPIANVPMPLPPPPPPPERPIPRSFWYAAGTTGVLAVATTVTGIAALSAESSYKSANQGTTPERADDLRADAKTLNITTDVLLTGTIVAAAVTTIIYLVRPAREPAGASMTARGWR
jgi:hypothetical protein